jgi:hypothetical protein
MESVNRRDALKLATAGAAVVAMTAFTPSADGQEYRFESAEPAKSCRLLARTIDDTKAEAKVVTGIINDTYILIVKGKKPYLNMKVLLSPLTYIRQPEYWGIEVLGCVPGIVLPTIGVYEEFLPLDGIRGTKGIEVIWSGGETEKIDVP